ncbi:squalene/phytoene synthase family protein [Poseidonocella sedimentorum]|uniref:Squalene/phytoene synthase n=1 Tax=Poseidonocella sedimentorum TaxID=871652 RepID=A0A1I6DGN1_9RHOB|nr:squalene/phytoene synthase family protein [Poseidonocella sedimentorum]SFR04594.1 Squalene/phytoene synthase [Poseidonocella sedimentorum]
MTVEACAGIVQRGDPDRFTAIMAGPVSARATLFALFAFNVEVARAPWVTEEALIAEMRLQWWHDVLDEIARGGPVRRHEVATPLADVIGSAEAELLKPVVAARRWDISPETFRSSSNISTHIEQSAGALYAAGASAFGAQELDPYRRFGCAVGMAQWLRAAAELTARGRFPLHRDDDAAIVALAQGGLEALRAARAGLRDVSLDIKSLLRTGWQTEALLRIAKAKPWAVRDGALALSPFRAKLSLIRSAVTGRI